MKRLELKMPVLSEEQLWSSCPGLFKQLVAPCVSGASGPWRILAKPSLLPCTDLTHGSPSLWLGLESLLIGHICLWCLATSWLRLWHWQCHLGSGAPQVPSVVFQSCISWINMAFPMGNVSARLRWVECKQLLQHFWDPQEAAVLSDVKPLIYNLLIFMMGIILLLAASHVRGTYSISKYFTKNPTLPPKIPVFEQNWKRNEVLLLCFGFPIGHAEYLITASERHEFLFGFLPELLWLILAQEQISGCSQWILLFCPDLAVLAILLKGLQVLRGDTSALMYAHMCGQYTHISPEVLP